MSCRLVGSLWVITLCALVTGCASSKTEGLASYYADKYQGRKTANGETFDSAKLTAAHKTLPFGSRVRVTNLDNGKSVEVRINDRGPYVAGRVIDLSPAAAKKLDMLRAGVVRVKIDVLGTSPVASIND
jgi:rare lipoprotein A